MTTTRIIITDAKALKCRVCGTISAHHFSIRVGSTLPANLVPCTMDGDYSPEDFRILWYYIFG